MLGAACLLLGSLRKENFNLDRTIETEKEVTA